MLSEEEKTRRYEWVLTEVRAGRMRCGMCGQIVGITTEYVDCPNRCLEIMMREMKDGIDAYLARMN